jgi:cell division septal protein FtsQ
MVNAQNEIRFLFSVGFSIIVFVGLFWVLTHAMHSGLFLAERVILEQAGAPQSVPHINETELKRLTGVEWGKQSLYSLNLKQVESNILGNQWIRSVQIQKQFPETLGVQVRYREPLGVFQEKGGGLHYIDQNGEIFGNLDLEKIADLPVVTASTEFDARAKKELLLLLKCFSVSFAKSKYSKKAKISALTFDQSGWELVIVYPSDKFMGRALVSLSQSIDGSLESSFIDLSRVIDYLSSKEIQARSIYFADAKKIVVRTARRS